MTVSPEIILNEDTNQSLLEIKKYFLDYYDIKSSIQNISNQNKIDFLQFMILSIANSLSACV